MPAVAKKKKFKPPPGKTPAKVSAKTSGKAAAKTPLPPLLRGVPLAWCLAALLAACAGFFISVNTTDSGWYLFVPDAVAIYRPYLDVMHFGFGLDGWRAPVAPFYFPDHILFFALALLLPLLWVMPVYFYLMICISAAGWMMVCRDLGGGAKMQAAAWWVHILQLALWSYPGNAIFSAMVMPVHHTGLWVCLPWLLWAIADWQRWKILLAFMLLFGTSDLLVMAWFVLPALFALAVAAWLRKIAAETVWRQAAVCVGGVVLGRIINNTLIPIQLSANLEGYLRINAQGLIDSAAGIGRNWLFMAGNYPWLTAVWLLFVAWLSVTVWRRVLRTLSKRKTDLAFKPLFILLFIPSAMACPTIAQWLAGLEITHSESYGNDFVDFTYRMRYVFPFVLLPLFIGWCFVPLYAGRLPALPAWLTDARIIAAAAVLLMSVAAPRIALAFTDGHIISPFNTPFAACVREAANRLGWTGGIGNFQHWGRAVIDPDNPVKQHVVIHQIANAQVPGVVAWDVANRHWFSGEFAAVLIDSPSADIRYLSEPRHKQDFCTTKSCRDLFFLRRISGEFARHTFGEPAEVVECEGVPIYHYDPPIRLDHSHRTTPDDYPAGLPRHGKVKDDPYHFLQDFLPEQPTEN